MLRNRLFATLLIFALFAEAQEPKYDQVFFANSRMQGRYFYSRTSYVAPSWVKNIQNKLPVNASHFFTPGNSLELEYTNGSSGNWYAVITRPEWRGQDITQDGNILHFKIWVASSPTSIDQLPAIEIGKSDTIFSKPLSISKYLSGVASKCWIPVRIPLKDFSSFEFQTSSAINVVRFRQHSNEGKEHKIFIDDIEIQVDGQQNGSVHTKPVILKAKGYSKHIDLEWPDLKDPQIKYAVIHRSPDGKTYTPIAIQSRFMSRFADFVGETGKTFYYRISYVGYNDSSTTLSQPVNAQTRRMSDDELLTMVQEACFRYYYEAAEANSGLAKENIPGRHNMIAMGASGFGLMALIAGTERKFISRDQAVKRFLKIVNFLAGTETFHGAFSHFVDGPTKKVEPFFGNRDNGGDLVETSFLAQGLLAAREYFNRIDPEEKEIRDKITNIWRRIEWSWYRRNESKNYLTWHWSPDQAWIIDHQLIGWNETMVTYLLGIASPTYSIPASMYYSGWASLEQKAQEYRKNWGQVEDGSKYVNAKMYYGIPLPVGVSNGGPLFFTHYSYLGYDPRAIKDAYTNYFENNRNIALINYRYCVENPGKYLGYSDSCWGLTAGDGPFRYSASEPVLRMDDGKMVPTGAISSFPYTPEQSMSALKNYYNNYGHFLWGEYGFRDAFNLTENWCSEIFMGLNQAPMVVMIENYRTGLLWKLFMKNADIQTGLKKISMEKPLIQK